MLLELSLAAALAVPTLSTPFQTSPAGATKPAGPARFVDPSTLKPLPGFAPLPADAVVELSPNRRQVAVAAGKRLEVRSRRSGRRLVRLRGGGARTFALVWTGERRLVALRCGAAGQCKLSAYDPVAGRRLRSKRVPGFPATTSSRSFQTVGDQSILWMTERTSSLLRAYVIDRDGRIQRTVRGMGSYAFSLQGRVAATARGLVTVDPRRGTFSRVPYRDADGTRLFGSNLVGRTADGGVWTVTSASEDPQTTLALLDERTLDVRRTAGPLPADVRLLGVLPDGGFLAESPSGDELVAYAPDGEPRWEKPAEPATSYGIVGNYVYGQSLNGGDYQVVARDTRTGRTVTTLDRQLRIESVGRRAARGLDAPLFGDDVEIDD